MEFQIDHDYHIHSTLSLCCGDPLAVPENILDMYDKAGFKKICLTNHCWDEDIYLGPDGYQTHTFKHICKALPLPQGKNTRFCFGAETDMDKFLTVGMLPDKIKQLDFLIVSTTHMHLTGFTVENYVKSSETRSALWTARFAALLEKDLPWHKVGIAHLTTSHIDPDGDFIEAIKLVPDDTLYTLFKKSAMLGCGIELNFDPLSFEGERLHQLLRPYKIAKEAGCKFYLGSDFHGLRSWEGEPPQFAGFRRMLDALGLTEEDKFDF